MTISGFTRMSDPISASTLATKISTDIGKTVTVEVSPTDVLVTGGTLISGDKAAIQTSMNSYFYAGLEYGVGLYADDDSTMATNSGIRVPTQRAVKAYMDTKTKVYVNGSAKAKWIFYVANAVTATGTVTFYITDNGLSTGNAVYTNVYADSIFFTAPSSSALYTYSSVTVSTDKKSITASVNQVSSIVLGLLSVVTPSNGVTVQLTVIGD